MISIILLVTFVTLLINKCWSCYKYYSPERFPPGPRKWPVIGNLLEFRESPLVAMTSWKQKFGKVVGVQLGDLRTIVINDYDMIKEALRNEAFNGRPEFLPAMLFAGGERHGTLTSEGNPWDTIRRFTMKHLNNLGFGRKTMEGCIQNDIAKLMSDLKIHEGKPVDFGNAFYLTIVNNLWLILMGEEIPEEEREHFHNSIANLNRALWQPIGSAIWVLPLVSKLFPEQTGLTRLKAALPPVQNLVKDRVREYRKGLTDVDMDSEPRSLMHAFLQEIKRAENNPKSHFHKDQGYDHLEGMILNLFVTAAESINNTMNWALLYLSLYPEVQGKLLKELRSEIGPGGNPSLDDLPRLEYTKALITETFRIGSTSPFSNFQWTTANTKLGEYQIPKDTMIIANLYGLHHDEVWTDPETYRPERFLDPGSKPPPVIPFSVGLRTCLGQTFAKSMFFFILTNLVLNFEFGWDPSVARPSEEEIIRNSRVSIFRFCPKFKAVVKSRV